MRHFLKIAEGVDIIPVMHALTVNADLWNENDLRTKHPGTAHAEVDDIWVFFNDPTENVANDIQTRPYRAWGDIPQLRSLVFDLMRRVEGVQLGRVIITRLKPGAQVAPHIDQGAPAEFYTRYQLALQSLPGALFHIEDETVNFRTGELWWINNRAEHSVVNNSADDRIVIIFDVRLA